MMVDENQKHPRGGIFGKKKIQKHPRGEASRKILLTFIIRIETGYFYKKIMFVRKEGILKVALKLLKIAYV